MQHPNKNVTDDQNALTPEKSSPTKDSKVNSIALNTEATELSIKYHPKIERIFSEKSLRKYSNCNIVLTVNEQEAKSELKNSSHQFHDKVCPRRKRSV